MKDPIKVAVKGPLGPYAAGFCAELDRLGYAGSSAVNLLKLMAHLSRWMGQEGLTVRELGPEDVGRYVAARRGGLPAQPGGVWVGDAAQLLAWVGPARRDSTVRSTDGAGARAPGLRAVPRQRAEPQSGTVRYYRRFAGLFLSSVARGGELDVATIATSDVSSFLVDQCAQRSVGAAKNLVMALRSLLGYLHVAGLSATPLVGAVPAVAPWRERSVPRALAPSAVTRLLESCDRRTAVGQRDYAVLVVLARLGLRAGEVAALELADIDWRSGELLVRGKGDRRERLPLPIDVGEALAGYLRQGRPRCKDRHVFLRVKAPTMGLQGDGVTKVVHTACLRAGVPVVGAHRLRRANACEGYRYITKHEGGGQARYEILLEEARVARQVFDWVGRERLSIGEVVRRLNQAQERTRTGKTVWDRSTVWCILTRCPGARRTSATPSGSPTCSNMGSCAPALSPTGRSANCAT